MKQKTLQLTGGNSRGDRRELDFYPTPSNVTQALLDFLELPKDRVLWDPACGDFAMSNVFKKNGYTAIETDIIYGQDYFETSHKCDAIITNPPFNLSERFIAKAMGEARIVAMLLKSQYWHAKGRLELFERYTPTYILPLTWRPDFKEHLRSEGDKKGAPTMEVTWTVWNRSANHPPIYKPLKKP